MSHGGPLVANKAFYFFNYEGLRQTQGTTQVITVPDANARNGVVNGVRVGVNAAIAPVLPLYPAATRQTAAQAAQGVGQTDVVNSVTGHENYFVGRIDYTATNRTSLFARYTADTASVAEPNSGSPVPLWPSNDDTGNHYVTAELRNIVRPTLLNAVRFGFTRTQEAAMRTDLDNGLLTFFPGRMDGTVAAGSGIVGIGGNQVLPFTQRQTRYMIANDLRWTQGRPRAETRARIRTADDVRQPAVVRRRRMDVSEPHRVSPEPAVAVSRRVARTDRRRQKHRRVAADQLRPGRMAHQSARDDQSRPSLRSAGHCVAR